MLKKLCREEPLQDEAGTAFFGRSKSALSQFNSCFDTRIELKGEGRLAFNLAVIRLVTHGREKYYYPGENTKSCKEAGVSENYVCDEYDSKTVVSERHPEPIHC